MSLAEILAQLVQWAIDNPDAPGQQKLAVHGAIKQLQRAIG